MKRFTQILAALLVLAASTANAQWFASMWGQVRLPNGNSILTSGQATVTAYHLGSGFQATTTVDSGGYYFGQMPYGNYILLADLLPNSPDYATTAPTYHSNHYDWSAAPTLANAAGTANNRGDIDMLPINTGGGTSELTGSVVGDTNVNSNARVDYIIDFRVNKAWVIATNTITNRKYVARVVNGRYTFRNLPNGSYSVRLEYPRLAANATSVALGNGVNASLDFSVNTAGQTNALVTSLGEKLESKLVLFPNPAQDLVQISWNQDQNVTVSEVNVLSATGQRINVATTLAAQSLNLNTADLTPGLYRVQVRTQTGDVMVKSFMKQ